MNSYTASFDKIDGDQSMYTVGDGDAAVRLVRSTPSVAVDIETAGLGIDAHNIKAVVISSTDHAHILDPVANKRSIVSCLNIAREMSFHNAPFDVPLLVAAGLMNIDRIDRVFDTLVAARMAMPGFASKGLGASCERHLGEGYALAKDQLATSFRALTGKSKSAMFKELGMFSDPYCSYAGFDGIMTARLRTVLPEAVNAWTHDHPFNRTDIDAYALLEREQIVNRLLVARASVGIEIDYEVVDELQAEMRSTMHRCDAVLASYGIDTDLSRDAIKKAAMWALDRAGKIGKGHRRLSDHQPSADKKFLERIDHPISDALSERSRAARFHDDYAEKLSDLSQFDNRIRPTVNVMTAVTGRMSIGNPPLQQFPGSVRRMMRFDAPVTSMDWSSIEPVFAGNVFGEKDWIAGFEAGGDLYTPVAEAAGVDRKTAKVILLAQLYGQGHASLGVALGVSPEDAKTLISRVMKPLSGITAGSEALRTVSERFGKVQTVSGRIVPQPVDHATANDRFKGYIGTNHFVQGSCYDLLSESIAAMHRAGLGGELHMAVHDELVVSTDAADEVEQIMLKPPPEFVEMAGRVPKLRVGRVDLGYHWEDTH